MSLSSTPFLATLTIKMYAHIVGGTRIRGSKLEGNSFELTTSHFLRLLKESKLPDALSPLIEEVTQLQDLLYRIRQKENIVDEITQKAKELSNNHSLLLPGHWIFSSGKGHVIIYELIKEDGQCFTLHIINSARSEYFPRVQRNKKIYQAFLTYRHIPQEVLFDSNCISLLIQLWCNAIDNPNFPVEKVLFSASLQPLFSYIDNEEISSNRGYWIPVQKVSTCTWDVWMAYLKIRCVRSGLGEEAYGDLRLEFKTDTMLKEHEYCKNCDSSQRLYLLEMGNKHLAYSASKLEKRGRVECDQDIYNTCTKLVRELYVDIVKEKQALKKEPCIENVLLCSRDFMRMPQETSFDLSTENIEKTSPLPLLSDEMITGENAQRISSELLSYMESGKNKKQNLFRYLVERFAYHISLDAECWNNPTSCKNIFSIAFRYAHFLENGAQSISLRQINTMLALYLIAWHMIPYCPIQEGYCKDPNAFLRLIQRLDPSPSLIEATYTNPLLAPFDLREQKRLDELREHFLQKTHHNGIDLFQKILTQKVIENVEQDVELDFYRQSKELILDPERHYYMFIDGEKTEVKTEEEQIAFLAVRSGAWEIFPWIPYLREIHYSLAFLQCLIKSPVGRVVQRTDNKLIIKTLSQQKQTELVDKYTYQYGYKRIPPFLRKALNYQLYAQKDRETLLEEEDILLKHIAFLVRKKRVRILGSSS